MTSLMRAEALEAPQAVARQLAADHATWRALAADLQAHEPQALVTVARGSSDHAAHYMAYLVMSRLGRLVTSLPMSLVTLYPARLRCSGLVSLAFSQSGQSPDLVAPARFFAAGGARTVAFVNDADSLLARACQWVLLHAGAETSVAATKSFIAQLAAGARLVAAWEARSKGADPSLREASAALPVSLVAPAGTPGAQLPLVSSGLEDLDPIAAIQSFYLMVEQLARERGLDPDAPRHLAKVTRTR